VDDARLNRRLTVILVTTRAAVASLQPDGEQVTAAIRRGIALLESLEADAERDGDHAAIDRVRQARVEVESLDEGSAG
jgi:hypothetical protein